MSETFRHHEKHGSLFTNEKGKDSHPDYRGKAVIDGVDYEIAGWKKEGKKGVFLSLKFQRADEAEKYKKERGGESRESSGDQREPPGDPEAPPEDLPF